MRTVIVRTGRTGGAIRGDRHSATGPRTDSVPHVEHSEPPRLSIVLPAYNEAARLPATLAGWHAHLTTRPYRWEIVVSDDGSTDDTAALAEAFADSHPGVRVVRMGQNRGKGGAVRHGMLAAVGDVILYADADLNVPPRFVDDALALIDAGADVAVGERSLRSYANEEKSLTRLLAGLAVQVTRRALGLTFIRDTQCGFKAFRREVAHDIFRGARITSFAFDIEILFLARRRRVVIRPFPVEISYRAGSTYDIAKHLPRFLRDIVRIRVNALSGAYDEPPPA